VDIQQKPNARTGSEGQRFTDFGTSKRPPPGGLFHAAPDIFRPPCLHEKSPGASTGAFFVNADL
jgi:hypothetical protein